MSQIYKICLSYECSGDYDNIGGGNDWGGGDDGDDNDYDEGRADNYLPPQTGIKVYL
jgi:hypothetical protein